MNYRYGMRLRGFSIGCQPMKGLVDAQDDASGRYYSILGYDHKLDEREEQMYELDFIGAEQ